MCGICDTARRFPSARHALEFLANQMLSSGSLPNCADKLIGDLVGVPEVKVDRKVEADWERANHGTGEA